MLHYFLVKRVGDLLLLDSILCKLGAAPANLLMTS